MSVFRRPSPDPSKRAFQQAVAVDSLGRLARCIGQTARAHERGGMVSLVGAELFVPPREEAETRSRRSRAVRSNSIDRRETIWLAVGTPAAASKRAPLPAQFSIAGGSVNSGQAVHNRHSRNRITGCNPERELPVSRRHFDRCIRIQCASDAQRALLAALMALPSAAAIGANGT